MKKTPLPGGFTLKGLLVILAVLILLAVVIIPIFQARLDAAQASPSPYAHAAYAEAQAARASQQDYGG